VNFAAGFTPEQIVCVRDAKVTKYSGLAIFVEKREVPVD